MRFVTVFLLGLALAACSTGTSTSEVPVPTLQGSPAASMDASMGASMGSDMSMGAVSPPTATSCQEAFDSLTVSGLDTVSDLGSLSDELDATIGACPSMDEWQTTAQSALPALDTADAETWLQSRCADNMTLAATPVCTEVSGM